MWDVFISHAWEDKETIARPLADALTQMGIIVWFDEFTLTLGDSLRRSIDYGLSESKYGIVILSPYFFSKQWTQRELDGLVAKEISSGKVILPIWHNVTRQDVERFSPPLSDKIGVSTSVGLEKVVQEVLRVVRPTVKRQDVIKKPVSQSKTATSSPIIQKPSPKFTVPTIEKLTEFAFSSNGLNMATKMAAYEWAEAHYNLFKKYDFNVFKDLLDYAFSSGGLNMRTRMDAAKWAENHLEFFEMHDFRKFKELSEYAFSSSGLNAQTKIEAAEWAKNNFEFFEQHDFRKFKELVGYAFSKDGLDARTKMDAAEWALRRMKSSDT